MVPLSRPLVKTIASLGDVKGRRRAGLFVAEGTKCITDLARRYPLAHLLATPEWLAEHGTLSAATVTECAVGALREVTRLSATPPAIALMELPQPVEALPDCTREFVLALDCIQDPGNLGTIIRTCDWMGIKHIVASTDTVDAFNPKTVQATMGSLANVGIVYTDLAAYLSRAKAPVYGTFLDGDDAYAEHFAHAGVLVMGNEGRGISDAVAAAVTRRITIPAAATATAESLNVATATAIILTLRNRL